MSGACCPVLQPSPVSRSSFPIYSREIPESLIHSLSRVLKGGISWVQIQLLFYLFFPQSNTNSNLSTLYSSEDHFHKPRQSLFRFCLPLATCTPCAGSQNSHPSLLTGRIGFKSKSFVKYMIV